MGDGNATFLVRHLLPYHLGSILVPVGAWGSSVDAKCLSQSLCTLFLIQGFLVNQRPTSLIGQQNPRSPPLLPEHYIYKSRLPH